MKRTKTWLFGLLAVMLLVGAAVPSWAYTITVRNDTGMIIWPVVFWTVPEGQGKRLGSGETFKVSNDDWHNKGLCWSYMKIRYDGIAAGCNNSPFIIWLTKCGDMNIDIIYKGNCKFDYTSH